MHFFFWFTHIFREELMRVNQPLYLSSHLHAGICPCGSNSSFIHNATCCWLLDRLLMVNRRRHYCLNSAAANDITGSCWYELRHLNPGEHKQTSKSRKGGNVVAILQMVNKKDGQDFTEQVQSLIPCLAALPHEPGKNTDNDIMGVAYGIYIT